MEQMSFFKDSSTINPNGAYHITEKRALAQILSEGLRPQIGKRSEKAHESKPLIYITDGIDLPQWILIFTKRRLLNDIAILEISDEFLEHKTIVWRCNANEEEGTLFEEIPPQYLKEIPIPKITQKQLWNYYFSCLHDLAYLCYDLLDYKYNPELFSDNTDFYNGAMRDAQNVLMSLDGAEQCFSPGSPDREKIHKELIDYWKNYSLFNHYKILIDKSDRGDRYYSALDSFSDEPIVRLRDWVKINLDLELLEKSVVL